MGLGQLSPMVISSAAFAMPGVAQTQAPAAVAAHMARVTECTSVCADLNRRLPSLYPAPAQQGCVLQCMANKAVSPLQSICQHRYNQQPELIPACVAAGGAHPSGAATPDQGGRPFWHYLAIGAAVAGIGYVGYRMLKG